MLGALAAIGAAWGLTLPLIRIAVSTGHQPLGLILWQKLIMLAMLAALLAAMRKPLPRFRGNLGLFAVVAVFGAVLPGYFTFLTADDLPAGVRAIIVALVPMFVLPMALALGFERPDPRRAVGRAARGGRGGADRAAGRRGDGGDRPRAGAARADLAAQLRRWRRTTSPGAGRAGCTRSRCCSGRRWSASR